MITNKLKPVFFGAAAVTAATVLLLQHQAKVRLHGQNLSLHQRVDQLAAVGAENQRLSNLVAQLSKSASLTPPELTELLKLRGEVGFLRGQVSQAEKVREENRQLRAQQTATEAQAVNPGPDSQAAMPAGQTPLEQIGPVPLGATKEEALAKLAKMNARILTNTADVIVAEFPTGGFEVTTDPATGATTSNSLTSGFWIELPFRNGKYDDTDASAGDGVLRRRIPMPHYLKTSQ